MTRPDPGASEESYQPAPQLTPRPSLPKTSSSGSKFKIPIALRPRQAQSDNDRPPEASREEWTTVASNRNSRDFTILRTFSFQIPEIRRISASTTSLASDRTATRAQLRSRSELWLEEPKTFFNAMERGPSDTRSGLATDGLSPCDVSSSVRTGRRRSSFFGITLPTTQEETLKAGGPPGSSDSQRTRESDEDSCSSDNSGCRTRKNRSVVGSVADEAAAFSAELQRRSSRASEEERRRCGL